VSFLLEHGIAIRHYMIEAKPENLIGDRALVWWDRALQQRTTQQLAGDRQFVDELLARSQGLLSAHSQE
jgi:hypothetical protein